MKITEVRIFKKDDHDKHLRAFATITIDDCFVVRDIKVIEGQTGLFVAMPSRKIKVQCQQCHGGNLIGGRFCTQCGTELHRDSKSIETPDREDRQHRQSEHKDIAHPITAECRKYFQETIVAAYRKQVSD